MLEKGYTVLYQTAPVMLDTLISKMFKNDSSFSENLLNVDLLVIDDGEVPLRQLDDLSDLVDISEEETHWEF